MTKAKEGEFVPGYALHEFPFFIWYTYPQLLLKNVAPRPGSFFDRHGGSVLGRRQQSGLEAMRDWCIGRQGKAPHNAFDTIPQSPEVWLIIGCVVCLWIDMVCFGLVQPLACSGVLSAAPDSSKSHPIPLTSTHWQDKIFGHSSRLPTANCGSVRGSRGLHG